MTRVLILATSLAFMWALSVYADERPSGVPSEARWVKVDRVTDGDTIVLVDRTRVRLHGIDAPEKDQPYGSAATKALDGMISGSVYIVEVDEDRYGRLVGHLFHSKEGYDINASMVCAGYAWWYERYAPGSQQLQSDHDFIDGFLEGFRVTRSLNEAPMRHALPHEWPRQQCPGAFHVLPLQQKKFYRLPRKS